jgi:Co/Zn/Cd efflux system component
MQLLVTTFVITFLFVCRGWVICDPLVAIARVALMMNTSIPICKRTGRVLLNTTPFSIKDSLEKAIREATTVDGVLECVEEHFWTQSPGVFVGSLHIRIRSDANENTVLARVHNIFAPLVTHFTVQIQKDEMWLLGNANSSNSTINTMTTSNSGVNNVAPDGDHQDHHYHYHNASLSGTPVHHH